VIVQGARPEERRHRWQGTSALLGTLQNKYGGGGTPPQPRPALHSRPQGGQSVVVTTNNIGIFTWRPRMAPARHEVGDDGTCSCGAFPDSATGNGSFERRLDAWWRLPNG